MKSAKLEGQIKQLQEGLRSKEEIITTLKDESSTIIIRNDEYKVKLDTHNGVIGELHSKVSALQSKLLRKRIREDAFFDMDEVYTDKDQSKTVKTLIEQKT